jgi:hypothetical protein
MFAPVGIIRDGELDTSETAIAEVESVGKTKH